MWPPEVERVAALVRDAGVEARLEELPPGETLLPGTVAQALGYDCYGRIVVVLVPAGRDPDERKVLEAAGGRTSVRVAPPPFPFDGAALVLVEQLLLATPFVWLEAGSPRHVLGLDPAQLSRLTRVVPADLILEG